MYEKENNEKKMKFDIKMVIRILGILCIVFVFCPSFLVSCSNDEINISAMTIVKGLNLYGEKIIDSSLLSPL